MSAVDQPRIDDREVMRCECGLVQFSTKARSCRRCHTPFVEKAPELPKPVAVSLEVCNPCIGWPVSRTLPIVLKISRCAKGMSQQDLATVMGVARSHVSKFENLHATPTLESLVRVASALKVSPSVLMAMCEGAAER